MFTDGPVTPVRVEVLLDLMKQSSSDLKRDTVYKLLQPVPLRDGTAKDPDNAAKNTVSAAEQLGLVTAEGQTLKLADDYEKSKGARYNILRGADNRVLGGRDVEPYLALFYSYFVGLDKAAYKSEGGEGWADCFNRDVFGNEPVRNRFNDTKHTGLHRWFGYLGLGWYDSGGAFQAVPYDRVKRSLPTIFNTERQITGDEFMRRMAKVCPELDGGEIFDDANRYRGYRADDKQCSLGLGHALLELHEDEVIRLDCPSDSHGWNLNVAEPHRDDFIKSDRITQVEFLERK